MLHVEVRLVASAHGWALQSEFPSRRLQMALSEVSHMDTKTWATQGTCGQKVGEKLTLFN
jgi:hypothetical protein